MFGGTILKSLSFGTECTNFAQIFFKSHVITKYKKSRLLSVLQLKKKYQSLTKNIAGPEDPPPWKIGLTISHVFIFYLKQMYLLGHSLF